MFGFTLTASASTATIPSRVTEITSEPTEDMKAVASQPVVRFGFCGTARKTITVTASTFPPKGDNE